MSEHITINGIQLDKHKLLHLIHNNDKIQAIKYIKEETNLGLKKSKDIVDSLSDDPSFFDGIDNTIVEPKLKKRNAIVKNKDRDFKGSHVIKSKPSRVKNIVIFILLIVVLILLFLQFGM
ncbi:ribosomal protein L7/L12 [Lacinutrix chionoecetis]